MADTVVAVVKPRSEAMTGGTSLFGEIATVARNVYVHPLGGADGILYPQDPTLRTRGGAWNYQIYEQALADPRVRSAFEKRIGALAAFPIQLDPASDDPADVAAKDLVERAFNGFPFQRVCKDLLRAIIFGFSPVEIMWAIVDGEIMPVDAYRRDPRRFRFAADYSLRLIDWTNVLYGLPVPDRKFIVHTFDRHDGDPYGRGLGSILFWPALFKRQNLAAWLIHNDKFASPTVHGKHPADADETVKEKLLASCSVVALQTAIITDSETEIDLLEASHAGGSDTYGALDDKLNDDISEVLLGATFAANSGALDGGSGAEADTSDRLELAKADAGDLVETLAKTLIQWIVDLNIPAAKPPVLSWLIDAEEDLVKRAQVDNTIHSWGFDPSPEYVTKTYGGEWTKSAPPPPPPNPFGLPAQGDPPPQFAEPTPAGTLAIAKLAERGADQVGDTIAGWVGMVRQLLGQAGSLEEARDRLTELYPQMSGAMFAEIMNQALQLGDLTGRFEAGSA